MLQILPYQLSASDHNILEVKPVQQWKAYTLQHVPGRESKGCFESLVHTIIYRGAYSVKFYWPPV